MEQLTPQQLNETIPGACAACHTAHSDDDPKLRAGGGIGVALRVCDARDGAAISPIADVRACRACGILYLLQRPPQR